MITLAEVLKSSHNMQRERDERLGKVRPCRNKNTGERGITYSRKTERYSVFMLKPFYAYVGAAKTLELAVMKRDHYEALYISRLEAVIDPAQWDFKIYKARKHCWSVVISQRGREPIKNSETLNDFDEVLEWLKLNLSSKIKAL